MSESTDSYLVGRLASPPFEGVCVTESGDGFDVSLRCGLSKRNVVLLFILGIPSFLVAGGLIAAGLSRAMNSETIPWGVVGASLLIGLPLFVVGFGSLMFLAISLISEVNVHVGGAGIKIKDRGIEIEVPWSDIRDVRLRYKTRNEYQIMPSLAWPVRRGIGDRVVIDTVEGPFMFMENWHHEACEWVAGLIKEWPGLSDGREHFEQNIEGKVLGGIPSRVARRDWIKAGVLVVVICVFFGFLFGAGAMESWRAQSWPTTPGRVISQEYEKRDEGRDRLFVNYEYSVKGVAYKGDRYAVSSGYSAKYERHMKTMNPGDLVDVWYNPKNPEASVLNNDFSISEFVMSLVCLGIAVSGCGAIAFGIFGKNTRIAEKYGKPEAGGWGLLARF